MKNAVNERLGIFIETLKVTNVEFGNSINETKQVIGNWLSDTKIPVTSLSDILKAYPKLNARWLLTGQGEMLELDAEYDLTKIDVVKDPDQEYNPTARELELTKRLLQRTEDLLQAFEKERSKQDTQTK